MTRWDPLPPRRVRLGNLALGLDGDRERVEGLSLLERKQRIVSLREDGGDVVAALVLGTIDHADRAVSARLPHRRRLARSLEDQELVAIAGAVEQILPRAIPRR